WHPSPTPDVGACPVVPPAPDADPTAATPLLPVETSVARCVHWAAPRLDSGWLIPAGSIPLPIPDAVASVARLGHRVLLPCGWRCDGSARSVGSGVLRFGTVARYCVLPHH